MDEAIAGRMPWTLVIQDPMANSFIAPRTTDDALRDPPAPDPALQIEDYERTAEEEEAFGIDHLRAHGTGVAEQMNGLSMIEEEQAADSPEEQC